MDNCRYSLCPDISIDSSATETVFAIDTLRRCLVGEDYVEVIIPPVWETNIFPEYLFKDRQVFYMDPNHSCLIPEATSIIQHFYKKTWHKSNMKPIRIFYVAYCHQRQRDPQGFTQFGVELLGGKNPRDSMEIERIVKNCLSCFGDLKYDINLNLKHGEDYVEDGFIIECSHLGNQKQIASGGRHDCGIGFTIEIDRLLLAMEMK